MIGKHQPPIGDLDLAGEPNGANIRDGGAGPSGSDFSDTGVLGGMRDPDDGDAPVDPDEMAADDPESPATAGVVTALADVVGPGISDVDGSALD